LAFFTKEIAENNYTILVQKKRKKWEKKYIILNKTETFHQFTFSQNVVCNFITHYRRWPGISSNNKTLNARLLAETQVCHSPELHYCS
jgi:hypothetical protein